MKMDTSKSAGPAQKTGVGSPIMALASAAPTIMATPRYASIFFIFTHLQRGSSCVVLMY
jgi:hypothetical protein